MPSEPFFTRKILIHIWMFRIITSEESAKSKIEPETIGRRKKRRIYFGLIISFGEARAIAAHYVRQLICQTWFTDSINATFRRRSPYGKFRDLRLLRAQSRALAYTSHQSLRIVPLPDFPILISLCVLPFACGSPLVTTFRAALCESERKKSDEETRKSYFLPGGGPLWGYRDRARTSRAVFQLGI